MKRLLLLLSVATIGATLAGCVENSAMSTATVTSKNTYPPTEPNQVKIYAKGKPCKPYQKIGAIKVNTYDETGTLNDPSDISRAFREQAAKMGGDAVINIHHPLGLETGTVIFSHPKT